MNTHLATKGQIKAGDSRPTKGIPTIILDQSRTPEIYQDASPVWTEDYVFVLHIAMHCAKVSKFRCLATSAVLTNAVIVQKEERICQLTQIAANGRRGEAFRVCFYQIKEICRRGGFVREVLGRC